MTANSNPLPPLVLASASPRRRVLLQGLGLTFTIRPADLDETPFPNEQPGPYVLRLAKAKAAAVVQPGELALAADTVVVLDGELLGKPTDAQDAEKMLAKIAGREHQVYTGVALQHAAEPALREASSLTLSKVRMAAMDAETIAWYVATGEPMDKAGSYAVQGLGALFVEAIDGNYTNVVGLPLPAVKALFEELGWGVLDWVAGR
ncbi:MAG TPA: Maf family protein [Thermoanaerobaculia bacterium]|nr:Maf family protein [Thermoanaerobaculia bacterium]